MNLRAVAMVARASARRRLGSLVVLALLVGLVGAVVLGAAAGARRSATAMERHLDATNARDGGIFAAGLTAEDALDEFRTVDGITDITSMQFFLAMAGTSSDFGVLASPDGRAFTDMGRPMILAGRLPDPDNPDEVMLNEPAAEQLGLGPGDVLHTATITAETFAKVLRNEGPMVIDGPALDLEVVGVGRLADDLQGSTAQSSTVAVASPAFYDRWAGELGAGGSLTWVTWSDAATYGRLWDRLESVAGADGSVSTVSQDFVDTTNSAISVVVVALLVFALVALAAGSIAVGQAISRQVAGEADAAPGLRALGLTRAERAIVGAAPAIVAVTIGSAVAVAVAVASSGLFPLAVARDAEPDPGVRVDVVVMVIGWLVIVALFGGWSLIVARRIDRRGGSTTGPERRSPWIGAITGVGSAVGARLGVRYALDRGRGRSSVPARSAAAGVAVGVAGVVAVLVFAASLHRSLDEPAQWGWTWDSQPDLEDTADPFGALADLADEPGLVGVGASSQVDARIDGERVRIQSFYSEKGSLGPPVVSGRLPSGPGETVLGATTMALLDRSIGDVVHVETLSGEDLELTVVGQSVGSSLLDTTDMGALAVVSPETVARLAGAADVEEMFDSGDLVSNQLLLTYRDGVDVDRLEEHLVEEHSLSFSGVSRPAPPGRLVNLDEMDPLLVGLGAFFAVLGLIGLGHLLVVSTRRRAGQLGILAALGLVPGQLRSIVRCQGLVIALIGLVLGVPLGILVGGISWRAAIGDLGMTVIAAHPWPALALVVLVTLAASLLISIPPSIWAAHGRPANELRAE